MMCHFKLIGIIINMLYLMPIVVIEIEYKPRIISNVIMGKINI